MFYTDASGQSPNSIYFHVDVLSLDDDPDFDPTYRDFAGPCDGDAGFCDDYVVHEAHTYRALNGTNYRCSGLDVAMLAGIFEEADAPSCEHGLSASLCAGPMHYPADF